MPIRIFLIVQLYIHVFILKQKLSTIPENIFKNIAKQPSRSRTPGPQQERESEPDTFLSIIMYVLNYRKMDASVCLFFGRVCL